MKKTVKICVSFTALAALTLSMTGCSKTCDVCENKFSDDATVMTIQGSTLSMCPSCSKNVKTCDFCQEKYLNGITTMTVLGREVTVCSDCKKSATLGILG